MAWMAEDALAQALMQFQQAVFGGWLRAPQSVPVLGLEADAHGLAQLPLQLFGFRNHQLAWSQASLAPGLEQFLMAQQPELTLRRRR